MPNPVTEVAEFYHQLALLVHADMPLPECLLQVGRQFTRRDFRDAVVEIGKRTEEGESFTGQLEAYPQFFSPFHVQLLRLGERSGTLPEMLHTVARFARFQQIMGANLRDAIAYPLLVAHVSVIGFLVIVLRLTAPLQDLVAALPAMDPSSSLDRAPVPMFTQWVLGTMGSLAAHRTILLGLYGLFVLYTIWLFLPMPASQRSVLRLIERLPGSWRIARSLVAGRICAMWAAFLDRGVPAPDAIELAAELTDHPPTIRALHQAAADVRAGTALADALDRQSAVDRTIATVVRHAPEDQLAAELAVLAEMYDQRIALSSQAVARLWVFWAFVMASLLAAGVAIATFLPFYSVLRGVSTWMIW